MGVECSDQEEQGSERARVTELWIQDRKFHSTGVSQKDGSLSHTLVNPKVVCQMGSIRGVRKNSPTLAYLQFPFSPHGGSSPHILN